MDSQTHKLMDAKQKLMDAIAQLSDTKISQLLEFALSLNAQDPNSESLPSSRAYQDWVGSENDVYDELFADAVATR